MRYVPENECIFRTIRTDAGVVVNLPVILQIQKIRFILLPWFFGDRRQISLLIFSEFKRINFFFPMNLFIYNTLGKMLCTCFSRSRPFTDVPKNRNISQNSQGNTRCFPVNIAKFLRSALFISVFFPFYRISSFSSSPSLNKDVILFPPLKKTC